MSPRIVDVDVSDGSAAVYKVLVLALFTLGKAGLLFSSDTGIGRAARVRTLPETLAEDARPVYLQGSADQVGVPDEIPSGFVDGLHPSGSTFGAVRLTLERIKLLNNREAAHRRLSKLDNTSHLDEASNRGLAPTVLSAATRTSVNGDVFSGIGGELGALRPDGFLTHLNVQGMDVPTFAETVTKFLGVPPTRSSTFFFWKLAGGNQRLLPQDPEWGRRSAFGDFRRGIWFVDDRKVSPDPRIGDAVRTYLQSLGIQEQQLADAVAILGFMSYSKTGVLTDDETIHSLVSFGVFEDQGSADRSLHHWARLVELVLEQRTSPGRRQELRHEVLWSPDVDVSSLVAWRSALWFRERGDEPVASVFVCAAGMANDAGEPACARALLKPLMGRSLSRQTQVKWAWAELVGASAICVQEARKTTRRVPGWAEDCGNLDGAWDIGLIDTEIFPDALQGLAANGASSKKIAASKLPSALASSRALERLIHGPERVIPDTWVEPAWGALDFAEGRGGLLGLGHAPNAALPALAASAQSRGRELLERPSHRSLASETGPAEVAVGLARGAKRGSDFLLAADSYSAAITRLEGQPEPRWAADVRREFCVSIRQATSLNIGLCSQTNSVAEPTNREPKIVKLLVRERGYGQNAADHHLSQRTGEGHPYRTYPKLRISTRNELRGKSEHLFEINHLRSPF